MISLWPPALLNGTKLNKLIFKLIKKILNRLEFQLKLKKNENEGVSETLFTCETDLSSLWSGISQWTGLFSLVLCRNQGEHINVE